MRSAVPQPNSKAGPTRNRVNDGPLSFTDAAKVPPHKMTRRPLCRAEHAYELCYRHRPRWRDFAGGVQPHRGLLRLPAQEVLIEDQEFSVVEDDAAADHHQVNRRAGLRAGGHCGTCPETLTNHRSLRLWTIQFRPASEAVWQALFDHAGLEVGQTVVIFGAAGNVGAYAVQFARRDHLRSIATAGPEYVEYVRSLGADKIVNYRHKISKMKSRRLTPSSTASSTGGDT
jgi:hypothetical protein